LGIGLLQAVLFDLGDTLVYLSRPWEDVFTDNLKALHTHLARFGLGSDLNEFADAFVSSFEDASAVSSLYKIEIPMQEIIRRTVKKLKFKKVARSILMGSEEEFYRPEIESWQLYPDAVQTLRVLREAGLRIGLISNTKSDLLVHRILEKFDLRNFFDAVVTSAAVGVRKPRSDIFMRILEDLKSKPAETVLVGDSLEADILGAKILGIRSVHLNRRSAGPSCLVNPEVSVNSLAQFMAHLGIVDSTRGL